MSNTYAIGALLVLSLSVTACRDTNSQSRSAARVNTAPPADSNQAGNVWHMKKAELKQMVGWDAMPQWGIPAEPQHQIAALTMLVPTDWQFQGGALPVKRHDCNVTIGRLAVLALRPDKKAGLISLPVPVTVWTNDRSVAQSIQEDNQRFASLQDCRLQQPQPLAQRMNDMVPALDKSMHPSGAFEPLPGIANKLQAAVQQANQQLAQQGVQLTAEVGRIPVRSSDATDTGEGYLTVMQVIRAQRLPGGGTLWTVDTPLQVATFAPQGEYSKYDRMYTAMLESISINPEYERNTLQVASNIQSIKLQTKQRLNQIAQQMALDNANAARQQAAIRQDAQNYASHVYSSVAAHRSAALEHSSQQFSLYMGDQALYKDPNGGTVQLPSGSTHAWASQTGNTNEYILTDSASYNPNGHAGSATWTQMLEIR